MSKNPKSKFRGNIFIKMTSVRKYILENWKHTIRNPWEKGQGMITLPKPFSSPSIEALFADFYYWDTYFINVGLLADGFKEQAKNNLDNIAFFIKHMGYMPNASHLHYSSQPPLFTRAVYDYYAYTKDVNILKEYLPAMLLEYEFFMNDRITDVGLNQYGCVHFIKSQLDEHYKYFSQRVGIEKETREEQYEFVKNMFAVAESGWDCSPRFDTKVKRFAMDEYLPIDLNCLLYDIERKISDIYAIFGEKENSKKFAEYAQKRKLLISRYMLTENGIYQDYNFVNNTHSKVISVASFYPYLVGLSNDKDVLNKLLEKLELDYGISACEYQENKEYLQWDYPIMWAPLTYFVYEALMCNDMEQEARRIAMKYMQTVERTFDKTGIVWEKYNAKTGEVGDTRESGKNPMLGWSAGIYEYFSGQLKD